MSLKSHYSFSPSIINFIFPYMARQQWCGILFCCLHDFSKLQFFYKSPARIRFLPKLLAYASCILFSTKQSTESGGGDKTLTRFTIFFYFFFPSRLSSIAVSFFAHSALLLRRSADKSNPFKLEITQAQLEKIFCNNMPHHHHHLLLLSSFSRPNRK